MQTDEPVGIFLIRTDSLPLSPQAPGPPMMQDIVKSVLKSAVSSSPDSTQKP